MSAGQRMPTRFSDLLDVTGPDRPVMLFDEAGQAVSPSAFADLVGRGLTLLRQLGLRAGDRAAVWLSNRLEWPALLFAAARAEITLVALNPRYRAAEIEHLVRLSGASVLITERRFGKTDVAETLTALNRAALPTLKTIAFLEETDDTWEVAASDRLDLRRMPPQDLPSLDESKPETPLICFSTSGTTSAPKLVVHTQASLARHAACSSARFGFDQPGAAFLSAMPLCGIFGLSAFMAALGGGAPIRLLGTFEAREAVDAIRLHGITHLVGSDEMYRRLLDADQTILDGTRLCGFAAFTPGLETTIRTAAERGVPLRGVYGSSEVNAIFAVQPEGLPVEETVTAGGATADPEAQVRIRDTESGRLLGPGETGNIEIAAPANFRFYLDDPVATATAITADGFFRTGDVGYVRDSGSFVYLGRSGDTIRLSGFLVDPREIEAAIECHPAVEKAQVVAVMHHGQTRPVAFVVPSDDSTSFNEAALMVDLKLRLAAFKLPTRVFAVESFPTVDGPNGVKVQKGILRKSAQERLLCKS